MWEFFYHTRSNSSAQSNTTKENGNLSSLVDDLYHNLRSNFLPWFCMYTFLTLQILFQKAVRSCSYPWLRDFTFQKKNEKPLGPGCMLLDTTSSMAILKEFIISKPACCVQLHGLKLIAWEGIRINGLNMIKTQTRLKHALQNPI